MSYWETLSLNPIDEIIICALIAMAIVMGLILIRAR